MTDTSDSPVLVLGGTGKTGRRVARHLTAAGHPVRTAARTGGDVRLDLDAPATWGPALEGAGAVYVVEPGSVQPGGGQRVPAFVARAVEAGVRRVVLLSAHGVDAAPASHPLRMAEDAVRSCGAAWTILRPDWFAQNFTESFWREGVLRGALELPTGDGATPFVDAEDIAEVAAAALTDPRHDGQTYPLTGPRALTLAEAAAAISEATGREVRHVDVSPDAFVARCVALGLPEPAARFLAHLLEDVREHRGPGVADGVPRALDRPARSFEDFVKRAASEGAWSS
jgi:uncharacterized protein YbjT (DUF2867 family)